MDEWKKIIAVMTLLGIMLAFVAPALAQTQGPIHGGTVMPLGHSDKDMMGTLTDTKDTSMAASIMKKSGLEGIATPEGTYTLFVASDQALKSTSPDAMNSMMEKLKQRQFATYFVKGHLVSGMVMPGEMADGRILTLMNGKTMTVRNMDGGLMVDDATITKAIRTNNGVIYVMDKIPSSIRAMLEVTGPSPMGSDR